MKDTTKIKPNSKSFIIFLYRYYITLHKIIFKIRKKSRGKSGHLTEAEIEFLKPLYELYDQYRKKL